MSGPVVQLRVPEDTLARLDGTRGEETRSAWILSLIDRETDKTVYLYPKWIGEGYWYETSCC